MKAGIKKSYGLRIRATGELARIEKSHNGDADCCGEYSYSLTDCDYSPVFEVDNHSRLNSVLAENTSWYNTDDERPGWGRFKAEDFEPVEIEVQVKMTPIIIKLPLNLDRTVDTRDIPRKTAERYAGHKLPDSRHYVFVLSNLPENVTRQDLEGQVGSNVMFSRYYTQRNLFAVCDLPEEYKDQMEESGVLLICSETIL